VNKGERLSQLGARLKAVDLSTYFADDGVPQSSKSYRHVRDFHDGAYDSPYAFPWSNMAHNHDARVVIVAQDWASSDRLSQPLDYKIARLGYDQHLATNINLHRLLRQHLRLEFSETYAIDAFPFVKSGGMSARIPFRHIVRTARDFALPVVEIVSPSLVVCIGSLTSNAMRLASSFKRCKTLNEAIQQPIQISKSCVVAVAHTGRLGAMSRNRLCKEQVDMDWAHLAQYV
jgi:uracil-DNA glycosylase